MQSSIIQIDNCLISSEIITECFCCDLDQCAGACCVIGDSGAPMEEEECAEVEKAYPAFAPLMTPSARKKVDEAGFFEIDSDGDIVTPLMGNCGECVYTLFENDICFCAMERAFRQGKSTFMKPISCSLYPIRISTLSNGMLALNLHRWDLCKCAFEKGKKEKLPVYKFLREPLIRRFGEEFYSMLEEAARNFTAAL